MQWELQTFSKLIRLDFIENEVNFDTLTDGRKGPATATYALVLDGRQTGRIAVIHLIEFG